MERRGATGMGGMLPFFAAAADPNEQGGMTADTLTPHQPSTAFMRPDGRYPPSVWSADPSQSQPGQWGAFHPPGMNPANHPGLPSPHHQYPPQGAIFASSAAPVSGQYSNGYPTSHHYPAPAGTAEGAAAYVPQGHFSPHASANTSTPYTAPASAAFLSAHTQGNGVVGGSSPHTTHYQPSEFHSQQQQQQQMQHMQQQQQLQQQQQQQQQLHQQQQHNAQQQTFHQSDIPPAITSNGSNDTMSNGVALTSPPSTSPGGGVQSRLKNMIMSRQQQQGTTVPGGTNEAEACSSPPSMGEVRFSGSVVSAVAEDSASNNSNMQQMQDSTNTTMSQQQNFLACRTTESDAGSVVPPTSNTSQIATTANVSSLQTSSGSDSSTERALPSIPPDGAGFPPPDKGPAADFRHGRARRSASLTDRPACADERLLPSTHPLETQERTGDKNQLDSLLAPTSSQFEGPSDPAIPQQKNNQDPQSMTCQRKLDILENNTPALISQNKDIQNHQNGQQQLQFSQDVGLLPTSQQQSQQQSWNQQAPQFEGPQHSQQQQHVSKDFSRQISQEEELWRQKQAQITQQKQLCEQQQQRLPWLADASKLEFQDSQQKTMFQQQQKLQMQQQQQLLQQRQKQQQFSNQSTSTNSAVQQHLENYQKARLQQQQQQNQQLMSQQQQHGLLQQQAPPPPVQPAPTKRKSRPRKPKAQPAPQPPLPQPFMFGAANTTTVTTTSTTSMNMSPSCSTMPLLPSKFGMSPSMAGNGTANFPWQYPQYQERGGPMSAQRMHFQHHQFSRMQSPNYAFRQHSMPMQYHQGQRYHHHHQQQQHQLLQQQHFQQQQQLFRQRQLQNQQQMMQNRQIDHAMVDPTKNVYMAAKCNSSEEVPQFKHENNPLLMNTTERRDDIDRKDTSSNSEAVNAMLGFGQLPGPIKQDAVSCMVNQQMVPAANCFTSSSGISLTSMASNTKDELQSDLKSQEQSIDRTADCIQGSESINSLESSSISKSGPPACDTTTNSTNSKLVSDNNDISGIESNAFCNELLSRCSDTAANSSQSASSYNSPTSSRNAMVVQQTCSLSETSILTTSSQNDASIIPSSSCSRTGTTTVSQSEYLSTSCVTAPSATMQTTSGSSPPINDSFNDFIQSEHYGSNSSISKDTKIQGLTFSDASDMAMKTDALQSGGLLSHQSQSSDLSSSYFQASSGVYTNSNSSNSLTTNSSSSNFNSSIDSLCDSKTNQSTISVSSIDMLNADNVLTSSHTLINSPNNLSPPRSNIDATHSICASNSTASSTVADPLPNISTSTHFEKFSLDCATGTSSLCSISETVAASSTVTCTVTYTTNSSECIVTNTMASSTSTTSDLDRSFSSLVESDSSSSITKEGTSDDTLITTSSSNTSSPKTDYKDLPTTDDARENATLSASTENLIKDCRNPSPTAEQNTPGENSSVVQKDNEGTQGRQSVNSRIPSNDTRVSNGSSENLETTATVADACDSLKDDPLQQQIATDEPSHKVENELLKEDGTSMHCQGDTSSENASCTDQRNSVAASPTTSDLQLQDKCNTPVSDSNTTGPVSDTDIVTDLCSVSNSSGGTDSGCVSRGESSSTDPSPPSLTSGSGSCDNITASSTSDDNEACVNINNNRTECSPANAEALVKDPDHLASDDGSTTKLVGSLNARSNLEEFHDQIKDQQQQSSELEADLSSVKVKEEVVQQSEHDQQKVAIKQETPNDEALIKDSTEECKAPLADHEIPVIKQEFSSSIIESNTCTKQAEEQGTIKQLCGVEKQNFNIKQESDLSAENLNRCSQGNGLLSHASLDDKMMNMEQHRPHAPSSISSTPNMDKLLREEEARLHKERIKLNELLVPQCGCLVPPGE